MTIKTIAGLFYFLSFSLMFPASPMAQGPVNPKKVDDSLQVVLSKTTSDSVKARTYYRLAESWAATDTAKSVLYLKKGKAFSKDNAYNQALYYFSLGQLYFDTNIDKSEAAFINADKALSHFTAKEAFLFRALAWSNYAGLQQRKDNYKITADLLLKKVIPLTEKSGDQLQMATNYMNLALIFTNTSQYEKAKGYYLKSISLFKKLRSAEAKLIYTYLYAAKNYAYLNEYKPAKAMLDNARLLVSAYPESMHYVDYLVAEAVYFRTVKAYQEALSSIDKGMALAKKLGADYSLGTLRYQKYKTYTGLGEYQQAKKTMLELMRTDTLSISLNILDDYDELSKTYAKLGQMDSAYVWSKRRNKLSDSLHESRLVAEISGMEVKFRNAENQKKIAELNTANTRARLDASNSRLLAWLFGAIGLFLLVLLVMGYLFYRGRKKSSAQQEKIRITQAMLQGQEEERSRVAQDLHDGLGGLLAGIKINLSDFVTGHKALEDNKELTGIIEKLDTSVKELRRIAHNMMPEMLLKLGLESSLKDLYTTLSSKNLSIDFQWMGISDRLSVQEELTIYRIIQELLTNVVKHAKARNVLLQCAQNENILLLTIEDDGIGFDANAADTREGLGLSNIRNRVAYMNGKMEILSGNDGQGTSINIELHVTS